MRSYLKLCCLMVGLFCAVGCSVREDPDDSFAPRPENATSASYQIVRLSENRYSFTVDKASLLKNIAQYRQDYRTIKKESDFGQTYVDEFRYKEYQVSVQSFKDSDLDAAERYLKSLPDSITFTPADVDEGTYDIGDINWTDSERTLRIVDFYAQHYSDDWSPYAFVINWIPTARDGYGKLTIAIKDETLSFRRAVRKKIWTFRSGYFWVYSRVMTLKNAKDQVPMLLVIDDPNNRGGMNGAYLIMPRADVTVDTTAIDALKKSEAEARDREQADPWHVLTKERLSEAKVIRAEVKAGIKPDKIVTTLKKHRGSDEREAVLYDMIALCTQDPKQFAQRIEALQKK